MRELMNMLGLTEVVQPMLTQVDERRVCWEVLADGRNRGGRHEH